MSARLEGSPHNEVYSALSRQAIHAVSAFLPCKDEHLIVQVLSQRYAVNPEIWQCAIFAFSMAIEKAQDISTVKRFHSVKGNLLAVFYASIGETSLDV